MSHHNIFILEGQNLINLSHNGIANNCSLGSPWKMFTSAGMLGAWNMYITVISELLLVQSFFSIALKTFKG
jgi:hypothetical protein